MSSPNIINIQKFSVHDGDGIRTTVFFKGCALNCWWCHNPESQNFAPELLYNAERCTGCSRCAEVCPQHGIREVDGQFWQTVPNATLAEPAPTTVSTTQEKFAANHTLCAN